MLSLRSIKELEFDRAMGRVSDEDFKEMSGRLRTRAARLIRQLDAGAGYREQIERELEKRLEAKKDEPRAKAGARTALVCNACDTTNDGDAKFCKGCGQALFDR
jgi:hypothetical protein